MAYPEAAIDLVRMAGSSACSVTCEVLSEGGEMAAAGECPPWLPHMAYLR